MSYTYLKEYRKVTTTVNSNSMFTILYFIPLEQVLAARASNTL